MAHSSAEMQISLGQMTSLLSVWGEISGEHRVGLVVKRQALKAHGPTGVKGQNVPQVWDSLSLGGCSKKPQ